jgi:hypothetical protein
MAKSLSVATERPDLSGVFGRLTAEDARRVSSIFAEVNVQLLGLRAQFDRGRVSGRGTGLDLVAYPNTTWCSIQGYVETENVGDGNHIVSFKVELRPAWRPDEAPINPAWKAGAEISADCQHREYHRSMDLVWDRGDVQQTTPMDTALELLEGARDLRHVGTEQPMEHWLSEALGLRGRPPVRKGVARRRAGNDRVLTVSAPATV